MTTLSYHSSNLSLIALDVITSANCYRDYQGLFQAMHEITDVYLRGKNEHGFKQHGVKHTD